MYTKPPQRLLKSISSFIFRLWSCFFGFLSTFSKPQPKLFSNNLLSIQYTQNFYYAVSQIHSDGKSALCLLLIGEYGLLHSNLSELAVLKARVVLTRFPKSRKYFLVSFSLADQINLSLWLPWSVYNIFKSAHLNTAHPYLLLIFIVEPVTRVLNIRSNNFLVQESHRTSFIVFQKNYNSPVT